jgi:hypothetical protein
MKQPPTTIIGSAKLDASSLEAVKEEERSHSIGVDTRKRRKARQALTGTHGCRWWPTR